MTPTFKNLGLFALKCKQIISEMEKAIVGKRLFLEKVLCTIIAGGHVLIEDPPGLAKTLSARCFATVLGLAFKRIQFTPDLLPADITGGYILNRRENKFELIKGPIFSNMILGDEINRAPAKTQAAMLEAMEERQVTLEGETMLLPDPFIVIATQNPIEYEGTYPLPEAQLDRFMIMASVGYPDKSEEFEILKRRWERREDPIALEPIIDAQELRRMRDAIEHVHIAPEVAKYIVNLIQASRSEPQIEIGASPRASLALLKLSRAKAAAEGRTYVIPDDIKFFFKEVIIHRLIIKPDVWAIGINGTQIAEQILKSVSVPKVD